MAAVRAVGLVKKEKRLTKEEEGLSSLCDIALTAIVLWYNDASIHVTYYSELLVVSAVGVRRFMT